MSKSVVILNPKAGGAANLVETIERLAKHYDCELCLVTESHLKENVREVAEDTSRVIVVGGDGTIGRVVNTLLPNSPHVELGIIPGGTANDLARSLDIRAGDIEAAFEIAVSRPAIPIDVVRSFNGGSHYFVNAATGGFGGEVTASLNTTNKHVWGPFSYWMSAMAKLVDLRAYDLQLDLDGEVDQLRVYGIGLANGRYVGGGFPIAGTALLNDGLMDVTLIPEMPTLELLGAGVNFMLGWQSGESPVITRRARRVLIRANPDMSFSLDGEPMRALDALFEVMPEALRVVGGDSPAILPAAAAAVAESLRDSDS